MNQARNQATPPAAPAVNQGQRVVETAQVADPQAAYEALVAQRNELRSQVGELESKRYDLARRVRTGTTTGADRAGLEERMTALDKQIVAGYAKVAAADAAVAAAAAVPGAVPPAPPTFPNNGPSDGMVAVSIVFTLAVLLPVSLAFARRIWRRSSAAMTAMPAELMERLMRLEESVDAVAIEVERIGEGQRFVTSLFVEGGAPQMLGAGAMAPVEVKQRERVEQERRS